MLLLKPEDSGSGARTELLHRANDATAESDLVIRDERKNKNSLVSGESSAAVDVS